MEGDTPENQDFQDASITDQSAVEASVSSTYKVLGRFGDASGAGVLVHNTATSGRAHGVEGITDSEQNEPAGVYGEATTGSGTTYGVEGITQSPNQNATAIRGISPHGDGDGVIGIARNGGIGVGALTDSSSQVGMLALNTDTAGQAIAHRAKTSSGVAGSAAVVGDAESNSGLTYGVEGRTASPDGYGLYTPDDARIEGTVDTNETDFVVESGSTTTGDATNVIHGHASNRATSGVVGGVIGGGGYDDGSTVEPNWVVDDYGTVGGGRGNRAGASGAATALLATVGGGETNTASGENATVGGGLSNDATVSGTTVGGGKFNEAEGVGATVGGGVNNTVLSGSDYASIGGGRLNDASGTYATVPGGLANEAGGESAFAAGQYAAAEDDNAFVWNDGSGATDGSGSQTDQFSSSTSDSTSSVVGSSTVNVKTTGGIRIITTGDNSAVTWIPGGSAGWSSNSSRGEKTNIEPVDPQAVLDGVTELDVSTWEYAHRDGGGQGMRHMGPMAEEFHAAFDVGASDTGINSINADGVAFAAIQGLTQKLEEKDDRIETQTERIDDLEAENEQLRERLAAIETQVGADPALAGD